MPVMLPATSQRRNKMRSQCGSTKRSRFSLPTSKRFPGLGRLRLRGPCGANDEFLLAATAQILRELVKIFPALQQTRKVYKRGTRAQFVPSFSAQATRCFSKEWADKRPSLRPARTAAMRRKRPLQSCGGVACWSDVTGPIRTFARLVLAASQLPRTDPSRQRAASSSGPRSAMRDQAAIDGVPLNGRIGGCQAAAVASISNSSPGMARRVTPSNVIGGATW